MPRRMRQLIEAWRPLKSIPDDVNVKEALDALRIEGSCWYSRRDEGYVLTIYEGADTTIDALQSRQNIIKDQRCIRDGLIAIMKAHDWQQSPELCILID